MENKLGMVGMGRIQNGVMTFVDASGKGFAKTVSRPVVKETIKEEVIMTTEKPQVLDVPTFMKNRIKEVPTVVEEPKSNVVLFPTKLKVPVKRTLRNDVRRLVNYLFELGEE